MRNVMFGFVGISPSYPPQPNTPIDKNPLCPAFATKTSDNNVKWKEINIHYLSTCKEMAHSQVYLRKLVTWYVKSTCWHAMCRRLIPKRPRTMASEFSSAYSEPTDFQKQASAHGESAGSLNVIWTATEALGVSTPASTCSVTWVPVDKKQYD